MKTPKQKLRTLKDLILNEDSIPEKVSVANVEELKKGAQLWIGHIKAHMTKIDKLYHQGQIDWINIFFNLEKKKVK